MVVFVLGWWLNCVTAVHPLPLLKEGVENKRGVPRAAPPCIPLWRGRGIVTERRGGQSSLRRVVISVRRVGSSCWMMFQIARLAMLSYSWAIRFLRPMIVW